jgi:di/tricarboxylate transporter
VFEDIDAAESKGEGLRDEQRPHWWIGPWAHVIAGVFFCLIYFPLDQYTWSWQFAVSLTYIVFMLCCTCGLAFKDSDDFFGNLRVQEFIGKLLFRQIFVLALVSGAAYLWRYSKSVLPDWVSHEGRRMSLWDYFGIILFYAIAVREAKWMAAKIKSQFPEPGDNA